MKSQNYYTAYFDGSCEPVNPGGEIGVGALIKEDGETISTCSRKVPAHPSNTNNIAEYMSFIEVLKFFIHMRWTHREINILGDSMLVIEQMRGNWRIKSGAYVPYAKEAMELLKQFSNVSISWIPREQNAECDELSRGKVYTTIIGDTVQNKSII